VRPDDAPKAPRLRDPLPGVRGLALTLVLLAAACGGPPPAALEGPKPKAESAAVAAKLPKPDDLPCFPCHSLLNFEKGPPFPHARAAHKMVGHCHNCHQGAHHEGRAIDKAICLTCHEQDSEALQEFARVERKSK